MGRPRKRRIVEEPQSSEAEPAVVEVSTSRSNPTPALSSVDTFPLVGVVDPGLSFLDEPPSTSLDFLDLLPTTYHDGTPLDPQILNASGDSVDAAGISLNLNGIDLLGSINFDETEASVTDMSKDISDSLQRYWLSQQQEAPEPPESLSSNQSQSTNSPESHISTSPAGCNSTTVPRPVPSIPCGCLSSLYLALDSLGRLPPDITSAMRVARSATKMAHAVINCQFCSGEFDPMNPPPIQAHQNLFLLATLVPSACNAYAAILQMIDDETEAAKKEKRNFWFSFKEVGGVWSAPGDGHLDCHQMRSYNNRNMEPDLWRTTMRAILRLDVYGFGDTPDDASLPPTDAPPRVLGLRDVVKSLEERSYRRHAIMDELAETGKLPKHTGYLLHCVYKPQPVEKRNCMQVLEAARIALDHLVIA